MEKKVLPYFPSLSMWSLLSQEFESILPHNFRIHEAKEESDEEAEEEADEEVDEEADEDADVERGNAHEAGGVGSTGTVCPTRERSERDSC